MQFESQTWKRTDWYSIGGTLGLTSAEQLLNSTSSPVFILPETTLKRTILPTPLTIKPTEKIRPDMVDSPKSEKG